MTVQLTEIESMLAKTVARLRQETCEQDGARNRKVGKESDEHYNLEGVAGEIAFCKLFNIYPDLDLHRSKKRPAADCRLHNGKTVDVKTTKLEHGNLVVARWKEPEVDLFGLMIGKRGKYRFAGFVQAVDFLTDKNIQDLGHGPSYVLAQENLEK